MLCRLKREESPGVATSGAFAVSAWILSLFLAAIIISYTSSHFKYTLSAVYFIPLASAIWHQLGGFNMNPSRYHMIPQLPAGQVSILTLLKWYNLLHHFAIYSYLYYNILIPLQNVCKGGASLWLI